MTQDRRLTPADFPREVLNLFDRYVHGDLTRRGFLDGAARHVGGAAAAVTALGALTPDFAGAQVVAPDDRRIVTRSVDIASPAGNGATRAYVAQAAGTSARARKPVVLVVHENRGLNPHIEDIARRLATHGFIAVAPDALTTLGGYPGDEDRARDSFAKLDRAKLDEDFVAAAGAAQALPEGNGKLGATGFCYGGGVVATLASRLPTLRTAASFYGAPPGASAYRRSGRSCSSTSRATTNGSTRAGRRRRRRWRRRARATGRSSMRVRSTASTTTPRPASTQMRRSSPGGARWLFRRTLA